MSSGPVTGRGLNGYALAGMAAGLLLLAAVAVILLAPSEGPPAPDTDAAARVIAERFSPAELDRAEAYRGWGRALAVAALMLQFGTLALLALWRGDPMRKALNRLGRRPLIGAMLAGAGIALLLALVELPLNLAGWKLGRDYGLVSQELGPRLVDWLMGLPIRMIPAAVGALLALFLWRKLKSRFWIAGSVLIGFWAIVVTWLWPVLVSPLFNDFEPLPKGPARSEVVRLADRAGVDVGEVYVVDASRRSTTVNAYVNGIGSSKRVVIYDNAIRGLSPEEFSALVGHELGHVVDADLRRGLTYVLLVIPFGVLFVQFSARFILRRNRDESEGPALIPVLALMVTLTAFILQIPGNALSRAVEAKADRTAISLTGEPEGLVDLQVRLAKSNLSDVDPPAAWQFLFGTHPSTFDRIAIAEGARAEERP